MKSLGRLRREMDHSWLTCEEGLSESGHRPGPRRGFRALPLAVRIYLVQSAARRRWKLQGLRVREWGRNAPYKRWDARGDVGGASWVRILDLRPTYLHNLSAGQWEASGAERSYLHIPWRGRTRERSD